MLAVMNREDSCPPTLDQEAGGWAPPHSRGHFELGAKPFNSYKGKKVYFHVRATKNINACLINYFLKCLFHFGSGSLKNVWSTIIIISGKKYTLLYFCFCCRSSCSSGWKVNTSLCSAAAHIFVVSGCPLGGRAGAGYAVGTQRTQRRHRNVGSIQRPAWVQVCWGSLGWRRKIKLEGEEAFRKSPGKESGCALRLWSPWGRGYRSTVSAGRPCGVRIGVRRSVLVFRRLSLPFCATMAVWHLCKWAPQQI